MEIGWELTENRRKSFTTVNVNPTIVDAFLNKIVILYIKGIVKVVIFYLRVNENVHKSFPGS